MRWCELSRLLRRWLSRPLRPRVHRCPRWAVFGLPPLAPVAGQLLYTGVPVHPFPWARCSGGAVALGHPVPSKRTCFAEAGREMSGHAVTSRSPARSFVPTRVPVSSRGKAQGARGHQRAPVWRPRHGQVSVPQVRGEGVQPRHLHHRPGGFGRGPHGVRPAAPCQQGVDLGGGSPGSGRPRGVSHR